MNEDQICQRTFPKKERTFLAKKGEEIYNLDPINSKKSFEKWNQFGEKENFPQGSLFGTCAQ